MSDRYEEAAEVEDRKAVYPANAPDAPYPIAPAHLGADKGAQAQAKTGEHMVNIEGDIPWLMINGDAICRLATPHPELSILRNRFDAAVAKAPPHSEEQVRAEERRLCRETIDRALRGHSPEWSAARVAAVNAILAIGSGHPLEEVMVKAASEVASWPEWKRSPDTTVLAPAPVGDTAARLAAAEARVRVLEGIVREFCGYVAPVTSRILKTLQTTARAALAKKSEGT